MPVGGHVQIHLILLLLDLSSACKVSVALSLIPLFNAAILSTFAHGPHPVTGGQMTDVSLARDLRSRQLTMTSSD
ncbi:hypothetical protein F5888DRAFT_559375 [Russula emetica]|nr:hypothetical protein F5888DRAFT_559375 [Russula emetica]